jgi:hypothetical protein
MVSIVRTVRSVLRAVLTFGVFILIAPNAFAGQSSPPPKQYPPGWNVSQDPPKALYDFRGGLWNDYQRYWPDQQFPGAVRSRSVTYGPIIYQFEPGSAHRHRVQQPGEQQQ